MPRKKLSTEQRKKQKRQKREQRAAHDKALREIDSTAGVEMIPMRQPNGAVENVPVRRNYILTAVSRGGLQEQHRAAAEMFEKDFNDAFGIAISSQKWEIRVDGGRRPGPPIWRLSARERLEQLKDFLGQRDYDLLRAVVIYGANPTELHSRGGEQHLVISAMIRAVMDELSNFYSGKGRFSRPDRTYRAILKLIEEAEAK